MAIKPMQKKKTANRGSGKGAGGKGQASAKEWELAHMYYMKGLQKGMGKGGNVGKRGSRRTVMMPMPMPVMYTGMKQPRMRGSVGKGSKGGGKGLVKKPLSKVQEKLKKTDASKLVWVGGLSPKTTWKALDKFFAEIVKPTVSDIKERKNKEGKITATVAFKTPEDVETVVSALNGSELDGNVLEVDKWEKPERPDKGERPKRGRRTRNKSKLGIVGNLKFAKGGKVQGKGRDEKAMKILKEIDASCKVWVGGLSDKTSKKALTKHFADIAKPKIVDMMKGNKAVVAFENEDDVAATIAALNATELDGKTIELDVWTKPERKPREKKKGKNGKAEEEA